LIVPRSRIVLGLVEVATGLGILLFWSLFFTVGVAPPNPPVCYYAFEHAFPVPDGVLAVGLIVGGALLVTSRPLGTPLSLAGAGGLIFLGLIDSSFDVLNGIYREPSPEVMLSLAINVWCIGLGCAILRTLHPTCAQGEELTNLGRADATRDL
jgi:hypothetical protein